MLIEIYRFSEDGFIPKYQNKIIEDINFWKNYKLTDEDKSCWRKYSFQRLVDQANNINIDEIKNAIFAFIGKPTYDDSKLLLNHLSKQDRIKRQWYKAYINDNSIIYADDSIVGKIEHLDRFILSDLLAKYPYLKAIIIPECSIKYIQDIELTKCG